MPILTVADRRVQRDDHLRDQGVRQQASRPDLHRPHPGFPSSGSPGVAPPFHPAASLVRPPKTCQDNPIVMTTSIRLAAILLALSLPLASCSAPPAPNGQAPAGAEVEDEGRGGAVPVLTARVEQKPMPVSAARGRRRRGHRDRAIRAQVTGQLSAVNFTEGRGGPERSTAVQPRFQAVPGRAQAGRSGARARHGDPAERAEPAGAEREPGRAGLVTRDQ